MEINTKDASVVSTKSIGGLSPYVQNRLAGYNQFGYWLSPSLAYWLWEKSDTVGDACDRIAMAFQQIEPALKDKKTGEFLSKPGDHPFLALMDKPGFQMDSSQLMYGLMTSFCVTGNCYPILAGNVNYEPFALHTISGNKANLIPDDSNKLYSINFTDNEDMNVYERQAIPKRGTYVYQADNQLSETIQVLITRRRWGVEAQSPLDRIYYQTLTKYYGNIHNAGLMENASRPGGIWSPGDGPMSQTQYEAFKDEVESKFSGPANAGRNIVAPRPIKYENFLLKPTDMDFVNLIDSSRNEIYNIYQIPLALVSQKVMTMSNFENSMIAFFDNAVLPRARFLLKRLGDFALPRYKNSDRFELTYDEKGLPALKARMFERAKKMREAAAFSDNEIRSTTGYEATDEGDTIWKPANLVPAGDDDYTDDNINKPIPESEEEEV